MDTGKLTTRRRFLCLTGGLAAGMVIPAIPSAVRAAQKETGVNPVEDLMSEHGLLRRVLLIYDEAANRIRNNMQIPSGVIEDSAGIIRRFIHNYHEKLEEEQIFPHFSGTASLGNLIAILTAQHAAGQRLTDSIEQYFKPVAVKQAQHSEEQKDKAKKMPAAVAQIYGGTPLITHLLGKETSEEKMTASGIPLSKQSLLVLLEQFVRMYRPHAAREDTVVFTAFRSRVSPREFTQSGEEFQRRQTELFGENGFGKIVESVAQIEAKLGIYDLSQFTPKA
ncbi:MAG: hemerythrin domain-containing protein [Syntrophobacteraceae bacterium]